MRVRWTVAGAKGAESSATVEGNCQRFVLRSGQEVRRSKWLDFVWVLLRFEEEECRSDLEGSGVGGDVVGTTRWDGSATGWRSFWSVAAKRTMRVCERMDRWVWEVRTASLRGLKLWEVRTMGWVLEDDGRRGGMGLWESENWVSEGSETKQEGAELHFCCKTYCDDLYFVTIGYL